MNKLSEIQSKVKAPKGQLNKFGNYNYRSCEDIVEAVKPIINPMGFHLTIFDEVLHIGDRYYIKATATLSDGTETFTTTALAREEETKKGMDSAQITGSASSYARKYALNGLFAIDDTKDADAENKHGKEGDDLLATLKRLVEERKGTLTEKQMTRLTQIINNKEESAYEKAISSIK